MRDRSRKRRAGSDEDWQGAWQYDESRSETGPLAIVKQTLRQFGLRPRKMFGQNFLVDEDILAKIVSAAELTAADTVVEVGPGLGVLTRELARAAGRVVTIEIDRDLANVLKKTLASFRNVEIVNEDILKFDPQERLHGVPYKVVANLPYYITSSVLRHFLEADHKPTLMVLMVQKEVGERIVAPPGAMSLLAVSVQLYGEPRLVSLVPASAFYPQPKVDSAIVRIEVFAKPAVGVDEEKFFRVVHAGFAQGRKQLHNALSRGIWMPPGEAPKLLREAGVDPMRRAQTLTLEEWGRVTRVLDERGYL